MINLYNANETNFEHNGIGNLRSKTIKAFVDEELNATYALEMEYPLKQKYSNVIKEQQVIKAKTPNGYQLFRIYNVRRDMSKLYIYALHIFYDLVFNFVEDTNIVEKSADDWLKQIGRSTQYKLPFKFASDIPDVKSNRIVRKNVVEILLDDSEDNSFISVFGGELLRDNFNVFFNRSIAKRNDFKIKYGKNLLGYTIDKNINNVFTRIMPIGFDGLLLPEKYVDSPRLNDYPFPRIKKIEYGDVKAIKDGEADNDKDAVPKEQAYEMLRQAVAKEWGTIDVPEMKYTINFVALSKTSKYKDFQLLEEAHLGDTVTVVDESENIEIQAKIVKYRYDVLQERIVELEAGNYQERSSDIGRSVERTAKKIAVVNQTVNNIQTAANGKNTVYRGKDRPQNANANDLWYEPEGEAGNKVRLHMFNGTDWELIPISEQNFGNININNMVGNHVDIRRLRVKNDDQDVLFVNENGEAVLNTTKVVINHQEAITKDESAELYLNKSDYENDNERILEDLERKREELKATIDEAVEKIAGIDVKLENKITEEQLENLSGRLSDLTSAYELVREKAETVTGLDERLTAFELNVENSQAVINAISTHFSFSDDGMLIGRDGSSIKLRIDNDKMQFLDGDKEVAYMTGQQMFIVSGTFVEKLLIANHTIERLAGSNVFTTITYTGGLMNG